MIRSAPRGAGSLAGAIPADPLDGSMLARDGNRPWSHLQAPAHDGPDGIAHEGARDMAEPVRPRETEDDWASLNGTPGHAHADLIVAAFCRGRALLPTVRDRVRRRLRLSSVAAAFVGWAAVGPVGDARRRHERRRRRRGSAACWSEPAEAPELAVRAGRGRHRPAPASRSPVND